MAGGGGFYTRTKDGIRVLVLAAPKAAADGVRGLVPDAGGGQRLKVAVTAAAEGGKANAALLKLLAKRWDVAKSTLGVVLGETGRRKTVLIAGADAAVARRLDEETNDGT